jgi:uncharacterized protein
MRLPERLTKNFRLLIIITAVLTSAHHLSAQENKDEILKEIREFRAELNKEYKDSTTSPLYPEDRNKFKAHKFYPVNLKYRVTAKFIRTPDDPVFKMKTSGSRTPEYRKFAEAIFILDGKEYKLALYQSLDLMQKEEYKDYLFLPFRDLTNGKSTYGGGRYIECRIPAGDEIIIDFNKAYNPYCAYSNKYNCPLVPGENHLKVEIKAGVKMN